MRERYELKKLSREGVPAALERAERYRLLNEPHEAESICLDVLAADPGNHRALLVLVLALSDQLGEDLGHFEEALRLVATLDGYERSYYEGLLCERRAKAHLQAKHPFAGSTAYDWLRRAMDCYERAAGERPPGNDETLLRWNACARLLMRNPDLRPRDDTDQYVIGE
jgi:hypothetical protein